MQKYQLYAFYVHCFMYVLNPEKIYVLDTLINMQNNAKKKQKNM